MFGIVASSSPPCGVFRGDIKIGCSGTVQKAPKKIVGGLRPNVLRGPLLLWNSRIFPFVTSCVLRKSA